MMLLPVSKLLFWESGVCLQCSFFTINLSGEAHTIVMTTPVAGGVSRLTWGGVLENAAVGACIYMGRSSRLATGWR